MIWIIFIGIAVISYLVQANLKNKFEKYSKMPLMNGMTGRDVAIKMLHDNGIYDVKVTSTPGMLTDHYNPANKTVNLSEGVYGSCSVAAAAVAAHECGHAIQHHVGYAPLKLRSVSVPVANFGSKLSWPLILIGLLLGSTGLAKLGVILFLFVVFFQVVTLPVEFNASRRAVKVLNERNMLAGNELSSAKKVLSAAAMTYVAAVFSSVLQLLRLVLLVQGSDRRRR